MSKKTETEEIKVTGHSGVGSEIEKAISLRSKIEAAKFNYEQEKKYFNKYKGHPAFGKKWEEHNKEKIQMAKQKYDDALAKWREEYGSEYKMETGGTISEEEAGLLPKGIGRTITYRDKYHNSIQHFYIDDSRPQKHDQTNESMPLVIWRYSKYPDGSTYDNVYKKNKNIEDANIWMDYFERTEKNEEENVKRPFAEDFGKKYDGMAESTAKMKITKKEVDPDYDWQVLSYNDKGNKKYYLHGKLKSITMEKGGRTEDHKIGDLVFAKNEGTHGLVGLIVSDKKDDDGDEVQDVYFRGLRGAILPIPVGQAEDIRNGHLYDAENNGDLMHYGNIAKKLGITLNPVYQEMIDNTEDEFSKGGEVGTKKEYENYLNEVGEMYDYESDQWIMRGKNRYDDFNGKYGAALKKHDPIAFEVGYNDWKSGYEKGGVIKDVSFFNIQFALAHLVREGVITEQQLDSILDKVPGNRIKTSELGSIEGITPDILGKIVYVERTGEYPSDSTNEEDRKSIGGILLAGALGAGIGTAAGYKYRESISSAREKATDKVIKAKQKTLEALEKKRDQLKEIKESAKRSAISGIERLEKGGRVKFELNDKELFFGKDGYVYDNKGKIYAGPYDDMEQAKKSITRNIERSKLGLDEYFSSMTTGRRKELGGILVAGLLGLVGGAAVGYGYREKINKAREATLDKAIKSKKDAIEALEKRKAKIRKVKEDIKSGAIKAVNAMERGGSVGYEHGGLVGKTIIFNQILVDDDKWFNRETEEETIGKVVDQVDVKGEPEYIVEEDGTGILFRLPLKEVTFRAYATEDGIVVTDKDDDTKEGSWESGIADYLDENPTAVNSEEDQKLLTQEVVDELEKPQDDYHRIYNFLSGYLNTPYMYDENQGEFYEKDEEESSDENETLEETEEESVAMSKGGKMDDIEISELSSRIGIGKDAIRKWLDKNGLSQKDALKILTGLGRKQLEVGDVVTAIIGYEDNQYSKDLVAYVRTDKAYALEHGGKTGKDKVVISVSGGVAEIGKCPKGVDCYIVDHDNIDQGTPYEYNGKSYDDTNEVLEKIKSDHKKSGQKYALITVKGGVAYDYSSKGVKVEIKDYDNEEDSMEKGGKTKDETTYKITVFPKQEDYPDNGELIEENIPGYKIAERIVNKEYATGFYEVVKLESEDGKFVEATGLQIEKGGSMENGGKTKDERTYKITVFPKQEDYPKKGELIEENIPEYKIAERIAKKEYATGFYEVVKLESEDGKFIEVKGLRVENGGKVSPEKKKLQNEIKTLEDAIDNSLMDQDMKEKARVNIEKKKKKIEEIEEEERKQAEKEAQEKAIEDQRKNKERIQKEVEEKEKKLRKESSKNKSVYIDIDVKLKEKMRNAIREEGIPYESKTEGDIFRVFLSNQHQLDIVTDLYNEKRAKYNMEPVTKEQVSNVIKKRVGKLKFMPVKVKPSVKSKIVVEKKRVVKKADKKRVGAKDKIEGDTSEE